MEWRKIFSTRMTAIVRSFLLNVKRLCLFFCAFSVSVLDFRNEAANLRLKSERTMTAHAHISVISCERLEKRMERSARLWNSYLLFPSL